MTEFERAAAVTPMPLSEPGRQPVAKPEFAEAMSRLAATVCVVACYWQGERQGRTATAVFSLSASPPSILVSLDRTCLLAELILASGRFSVAMLAQGQDRIADAFAGKHGDIDRFSVGEWHYWPSGTPRLASAATAIDCEVIGSMSIPSHLVLAGAIMETQLNELAAPLLWHRRQYHRPSPLTAGEQRA